MRDAGPSWRVVWFYSGAGCARQAPAGFEPIKCWDDHEAHEAAMQHFRAWITHPDQADLLEQAQRELRGWDLACSCPLDLPCHANVLLELVNEV
jgi:hypothetical protein